MGKRSHTSDEEGDSEESEEETETAENENDKEEERGKRMVIRVVVSRERRDKMESTSSSSHYCCCQADECGMELTGAKTYHRRHKVCERHAKAPVVLVKGMRQRFCQQCSRFHEISEFDDAKRSCRNRLAGHNERRRKSQSDQMGENRQKPPATQMNGSLFKTAEHGHPNYPEMGLQRRPKTKHFRIR